jgi:hypothetical protein
MRRHFLALEAFDNTSTGAPTDAETDKPDTAVTPEADPAAVASAPAADAPVPAEPTGDGTNPEPSEPDEAKPTDPAAAPALPAEPGVEDPAPVAQDAPTPAETPAEAAPAVPSEPTNASTAEEPVAGAESTDATPETPAADASTETPPAPAETPATSTDDTQPAEPETAETPAASTDETPPATDDTTPPAATEPTDAGGESTPAETPVGGADETPTPEGGAAEADSEAMESMRERLELSYAMEEAAFAVADAGEHAAEIQHDLAESERVIQVSDALEDLAFVADSIKQATPAEAALMETAGNMAVAGTDVEPDAIVPSMESFIGHRIATEGIKETAQRIWESIVMFIDRIWEKIRGYWRINKTLPTWRKKLDALKKMAGEVGDEKHVDFVRASMQLFAFVKGGGLSAKDLEAHPLDLPRFVKTVRGMFAEYANGVVEKGHDIAKAIAEFDVNRPEKAAQDLKNKLTGMHPAGFASSAGIDKLIGHAHLELVAYENTAGEDVDAALERLRNSGVKYVNDGAHFVANHVSLPHVIPVAPKHAYVQTLGMLDEMLSAMEHFYQKTYHEFDDLGKRIKTASAAATKAMGKAGEAAMAEGRTIHHYRSLLNFNKAWAQWTYQPFVPLFTHAIKVLRGYSALVESGLEAYDEKASARHKATSDRAKAGAEARAKDSQFTQKDYDDTVKDFAERMKKDAGKQRDARKNPKYDDQTGERKK